MPRPHNAEVAPIQRRDLVNVEPLGDGHDRRIGGIQPQIAVLRYQLRHPAKIGGDEINERVPVPLQLHRGGFQQRNVSMRTDAVPQNPASLDQDGVREEKRSRQFLEEAHTAIMIEILSIRRGDQGARVQEGCHKE